MWQEVAVALCLLFVLEGILPFLNPAGWRRMIFQVARMDDRSLRTMGFVSMLIGTTLLYLIR